MARWRSFLFANGGYYAAMAVAGGAGLLKTVGYGLILAPVDFGRLSLVTSLAPFLIYGIGRGAIEGAALDLPRLYGLGRAAEAALLLRQCMKRLAREGLIASVVALLALLVDARAAILCLAVPLAATTGILSLVMADARSSGAMNRYGASVLARVVFCSALGLPAALVFGFSGAVLGEVAAQFLLILWLLRSVPVAAPATAHERGLPEVRERGWKMMLHQFLQLLQQNGDKWMVSAALGPAMLGQYSFAGIFLVAVSLLHAMIYQQIGPAALRSLAEGESLAGVLRRCQQVALAAGAGVMVLGILAGVAYWWGLRSALAPYAVGFAVFPWVVLTAAFQIMNQHDWIISTGRHLGRLARFDLAATVVFFGLAGLGWSRGWPLVYFAFLACLTRGAVLLITVRLAYVTKREAQVAV